MHAVAGRQIESVLYLAGITAAVSTDSDAPAARCGLGNAHTTELQLLHDGASLERAGRVRDVYSRACMF